VVTRFYDRDQATGLPQRWLEMVRHTLASLGPKVQATRMVTDYVRQLYVPAARAGWAMDGAGHPGARDLAQWKARVRGAWPSLRVDHVESSGVGDSPEIGDVLSVRAFAYLDGIGPDDVQVQLVHGRVSDADLLADTEQLTLQHAEAYEGGQHRFEGQVRLTRTGAFGYTVRVLPRHAGLASASELGLVTNASA
jgi:starch phosphorylase